MADDRELPPLPAGLFDSSSEPVEPAIETLPSEGGDVVNYVFPVEIVLVGSLPARERAEVRAEIWQELQDAVNRRLA